MTSLLPFTTDIIRAFGWTLLHSFWQALVVFACLRIVLKIWPAASSAAKYHLSFLSLAGIFTWFVATFWQQMSAIRESKLLMQFVVNNPFPAGMPATAMPEAAPETTFKWLFPGMEVYFPVLVGVYVIGVSVMTIKLVIDLAQLQQIRRAAVRESGNMWEKQLRMLADRMCISTKVRLHVSAVVQVPVMIGFIRPLILLPAAMVNNLGTDQLEAILLHELAHIKRHDYLLNIFQTIVETILFFNPFIWWISKNIRIEREHCCDDLVIASTVQPLHYAKALVALEEYRLTTNPMAMAIADNKQYLFHRIKRIMEMKTNHRNYSQQFLALLIILTGVASIAWLNPSQKEKKEKKNTAAVLHEICTDTLPGLSAVRLEEFATLAPPDAPLAPIASDDEPCLAAPAPLTSFSTATAFAPLEPLNMQLQSHLKFMSPAPFAMVSNLSFPSNFVMFDTIPGKPGKIRITDDKGNVKEYNNINEMPEEDRKKMEQQYIQMQEAREQAEKAREQFRVAAEQQREAREQMRKQMAQQQTLLKENLKLSSEQYKKIQEEMAEAYKKIDWKKISDETAKAYKNIDWKKMNEDMQKAYKSIDWKKMNEDMQKAYQNINWDKMNEEMQKAYQNINIEKLIEENKKNGIDVDEQALRDIYHREANREEGKVARVSPNGQRRFADIARVRDEAASTVTYARAYNADAFNSEGANTTAYARVYNADANGGKPMVISRNSNASNLYSGYADATAGDAQHDAFNTRVRDAYQRAPGVTATDNREQNLNYRDLVNKMEEDKLIDIKKGFEIEKKEGALYINGAKQAADVLKKYNRYFKADKVNVKGNTENLNISIAD